jgi:ergothioneine biosynthesis protein EgtB
MRSTLEKIKLTRKTTPVSVSKKVSSAELFTQVRRYTEFVCEPLATEDYVVQPADHINPPKWHLAHTTWFFEEFILVPHYKNYRRFHPQYSLLFNDNYESLGNRVLQLNRGNMSRPTVEEIFQYRGYVDEHMIWLITDLPEDAKPILEIGLNHERQHQELLYTDIKFILGHNPLFPHYKTGIRETPKSDHDREFAHVSEGRYSIGNKKDTFAYDRESVAHSVVLKQFEIRKSLVTNQEYLQFIQDGGYQRPDYWFNDGWKWVKENNVAAPLYWHFIDVAWYRYALSGLERVSLDEPVTHISFYEASAFASWADMRLPTEFEWEAACDNFQWGQRWEHTNSAYLPYPGYQKSEIVAEYNGNFMVNNMVLRGASAMTSENYSRKTYRNFFNPSWRWQFNGVRLCRK